MWKAEQNVKTDKEEEIGLDDEGKLQLACMRWVNTEYVQTSDIGRPDTFRASRMEGQ